MNKILSRFPFLPAALVLLAGLVLQSCQNQPGIPQGTATALILPTVFPSETSTPAATATPRFTATPRGTLTATKEPDYKATPWAQYECADKSQIILRINLSGRVVKDQIELLEKPAAPGTPGYNVFRKLKAREHILVLDGPRCKDNETWWQVKTESSTIGWVRELDSAGKRLLKR
jgi:hypothetical protein